MDQTALLYNNSLINNINEFWNYDVQVIGDFILLHQIEYVACNL